ncbi:MAG: hypothetical protein RL385_1092 [Pseudomonadota bacterium]|jgi:hypothetical protein
MVQAISSVVTAAQGRKTFGASSIVPTLFSEIVMWCSEDAHDGKSLSQLTHGYAPQIALCVYEARDIGLEWGDIFAAFVEWADREIHPRSPVAFATMGTYRAILAALMTDKLSFRDNEAGRRDQEALIDLAEKLQDAVRDARDPELEHGTGAEEVVLLELLLGYIWALRCADKGGDELWENVAYSVAWVGAYAGIAGGPKLSASFAACLHKLVRENDSEVA